MRSSWIFILFFALLLVSSASLLGQTGKQDLSRSALLSNKHDSLQLKKRPDTVVVAKKDSVKKHDPRIATRRSALIPGWGQAYNRDYWKIPIVYGILAIPATLYFYNNSYYKKTKFAYEARFQQINNGDSSNVPFIDSELKGLSLTSLQNYRNEFRRDRDYSILWFLIAWGFQVADATVFAHLKQFDVSDDLSMEVNPNFNPQTRLPGISLTLNVKPPVRKQPIAR